MEEKHQILFPESNLFLLRKDKEALLNQRSIAIWLTGLSGSGKTTIARHLEQKLHKQGFLVKVLDGDIVRSEMNKKLDFSEESRLQNIRRVAFLNKEFILCGVIVINSFISPKIEMRQVAKNIIGAENFIEVFVNCPILNCQQRDSKGLYAKAKSGLLPEFDIRN